MFALLWLILLTPGAMLIVPRVVLLAMGGHAYSIPSGSMMPTLLVGDTVLDLPANADELPDRGQIVVFRHPHRPVDYIQRVVGLPGETVQFSDGRVHIDGAPVDLDVVGEWKSQDHRPTGDRCMRIRDDTRYECTFDLWRETLPGGLSNLILNIGDAPLDNTEPMTVPEGHMFLLGDHRDNSIDSRSRSFGMVPIENIKYRAWMVQWSFDGWEPRLDRLLKRVR